MIRQVPILKTKSALSYFGSDSEVADQLASLINHCKHVTIPFVGGAAILPHLKARAIVANDLNEYAINFYKCASGVYGPVAQRDLFDQCHATLSHPVELETAQRKLAGDYNRTDKAWAYWALCWIGRKGKGGTKPLGGMPSVRRTPNGGTNASRIRAAATDLIEWAKHFERCEWECCDFRELLPKVADHDDCGLYCDPPFMKAGRNYLHSFTEIDHHALVSHLCRFNKTTVLVRYDDHPKVREFYSDQRWTIIDASSRSQSNEVKGELWITNSREGRNAKD